MNCRFSILALLMTCLLVSLADGQQSKRMPVSALRDKNAAFYATPEGQKIIDNILAWQTPEGGWHKNYDVSRPPGVHEEVEKGWESPTIDNDATYTELRALARAQTAQPRADVLAAFNKGFDYLLSMQYPNGGWPQRFPLPKDYGTDITFNDDAMTNVLRLMEDVYEKRSDFAFVDAARRDKAKAAFDRGVDCILKTQIKQDGRLTGWCQQYDAQTLQPAKARAYELPSIAGSESATIAIFLMSLDHPSDEVKQAIQSAVAWFDRSKLTGIKVVREPNDKAPKGYDQVVVEDPTAPPLWARFYEIDTNRPFYCGRDGIKKYSLAEIELERRSGYAWLRPWGDKLFKEYAKWCAAHGEKSVLAGDSK
jgi:pectinesterase